MKYSFNNSNNNSGDLSTGVKPYHISTTHQANQPLLIGSPTKKKVPFNKLSVNQQQQVLEQRRLSQ
eukprot:UN04184